MHVVVDIYAFQIQSRSHKLMSSSVSIVVKTQCKHYQFTRLFILTASLEKIKLGVRFGVKSGVKSGLNLFLTYIIFVIDTSVQIVHTSYEKYSVQFKQTMYTCWSCKLFCASCVYIACGVLAQAF